MKTRKFKRIMGAATAASILSACMVGTNLTVNATPETTSTYTLTIPSTLTVANSGWNSIGNITASGTLEDGKKLNITATSLNNFALKSGDNSVNYTIKNASTDTKATTSWDFTKEQLAANGGATQAIGIDVSDYSTKPAGTYTDTVTFTAKVESAKPEYYDKLVECGCDNLDGKCANEDNLEHPFTGQVLSAAQAIALAQAKAAETSSNCAVFYDNGSRSSEIKFAKNDGTTGSARCFIDSKPPTFSSPDRKPPIPANISKYFIFSNFRLSFGYKKRRLVLIKN